MEDYSGKKSREFLKELKELVEEHHTNIRKIYQMFKEIISGVHEDGSPSYDVTIEDTLLEVRKLEARNKYIERILERTCITDGLILSKGVFESKKDLQNYYQLLLENIKEIKDARPGPLFGWGVFGKYQEKRTKPTKLSKSEKERIRRNALIKTPMAEKFKKAGKESPKERLQKKRKR